MSDPTHLRTLAAELASATRPDALRLASGQGRGFVRLLATEAYEAWLIAWAPSGALELHDHGGAHGALHVVRGRLAESYTDRHGPAQVRTRTLTGGANVVVPGDRVHEVWNPGPGVALSVHVYSPPLSTMTFYELAPDSTLRPTRTVEGDLVSAENSSGT